MPIATNVGAIAEHLSEEVNGFLDRALQPGQGPVRPLDHGIRQDLLDNAQGGGALPGRSPRIGSGAQGIDANRRWGFPEDAALVRSLYRNWPVSIAPYDEQKLSPAKCVRA